MINTDEIINILKEDSFGLSITDLVNKTKLSRGQVRISVSFLLGAEQIIERKFGMAKLYYLGEVKK